MTNCAHVQGRRAVFFDIDGTLVPERSSGSFLAERLGHQVELDAAEAAYAAGTMNNDEVCVIDANGWTGRHEHEIETWLADLPLISGIEETIEWCRSAGLAPYVASLPNITSGWDGETQPEATAKRQSGNCGYEKPRWLDA